MKTASMLKKLHKQTRFWEGLWQRWANLESLTYFAIIGFALLLVTSTYNLLTAGLILHDAATSFAVALRQAQTTARDRNNNIRVSIKSATADRPCSFIVQEGASLLCEKAFPEGVSVVGIVKFDPQGVPFLPTHFIFRKLGSELQVEVNTKGEVSIP